MASSFLQQIAAPLWRAASRFGAVACALSAALLLPTTMAHAATPQETAAVAEMQQLANALTACQLDTTYYVSLETLNDITLSGTDPAYDYLNHEGGTYVVLPAQGIFQSSRRNLLNGANQWAGPYVNYQAGHTQTGSTPYDQGSPLDPWGTPYYFFTPLGLVNGDSGSLSLALYGDDFDRYVIVSLGADGLFGGGDDLAYSFGGGITGFRLSSLRASGMSHDGTGFALAARAGDKLTVRGIGLGDTQNGATVFFGDGATTVTATVDSWSVRDVQVSLPALAAGVYQVGIERGANKTNRLTLTLSDPPNRAAGWTAYQ